jgi:hypothetical protein
LLVLEIIICTGKQHLQINAFSDQQKAEIQWIFKQEKVEAEIF